MAIKAMIGYKTYNYDWTSIALRFHFDSISIPFSFCPNDLAMFF